MAQYKVRDPLSGSLCAIEVKPNDTINDFEAKLRKEFKIEGRVTCHSSMEARDMKQDRGPQRLRDVYPKPTTFNVRVVSDKKPGEAENPAAAGTTTERHELSIDNNTVEDQGDMDNKISYPEQNVSAVSAAIRGNMARGNGVQTNFIGHCSPVRSGPRIEKGSSTAVGY